MKKKMYTALLFILMFSSAGAFTGDLKRTISFNRVSYFIVVKAKINNSEKKYNFIVDTGALTFIDKGVADELGLKQRGMMAKIDSLNLSGVKIKKIFCFTSFDVKLFRKFSVPIHGIIGSNLLDRYKVIFDFKASSITLSDDTTSLKSDENGIFMTFHNHPVNNAPIVKFQVGSGKIEGMIDTGQPYPLVFPFTDFDKYKNSSVYTYIRSKGVMAKWPMTNPEFNYLALLDSISFDNKKFTDVLCVFGYLPPMLSMPLIGTDFLSRFRMIINYPRHELALLPYKDSNFEKNMFSTGLNLNLSENGEIYVEGVWENSPADKAGIKPGDIVLEFDSKKVSLENLIELQNIIRDNAIKSINFKMRNQSGTRDIKLLKDWML